MEYPNTKLTHKVRLIILTTFIVAFFIIAPLVIMYTAGYHLDWKNLKNGPLKKTGAISIDVQPKNATVFLNGIKLKDKMPIRLNNIAQNKYSLRITAPNYFDWSKEIDVKENQTNYIKEISLIQKNKPENLINAKIDNLAISYDGRFIIYSVQNKGQSTEIWLWDNTTQQTKKVYNLNKTEPVKILWAEKNDYAIVSDLTPPYSNLIIINPASTEQINIAKNNPFINKFEWENSTEPQLYYSDKENINLYSPITNNDSSVSKNTYLDWYMENGQLWTMQMDSSTKQYSVIRNTLGFSSVFNQLDSTDINLATGQTEKENLRIVAARQNTLLLQNSKNSQIILLTNSAKYKIAADKFLISRYNNWWLIWSPLEIWTYSEGSEPNLLNRSGEHLQEVLPLDQYNTLALVWAEKTNVLFPYYLVTHDLLTEKITNVAADTINKILYFTDKNKDGIWKLNY
ncbi:MAG TPA: PEGA domain-containing protein [Candidatus Udaeobacter sp.]|nr:PEGA domain-containing protein [Candidatus Udaeobacter sp.]